MGRCPKKLQGGSRKSAVQKVLILPLRSSRRRRARPSLRSRRSQNRSRRRMPPPPRRRPPRQLLTLQLFVDTCPDFVTRKNYTHRFSPLSFSFGRKRLKTFGLNSGRYPMYLARLLLFHFAWVAVLSTWIFRPRFAAQSAAGRPLEGEKNMRGGFLAFLMLAAGAITSTPI